MSFRHLAAGLVLVLAVLCSPAEAAQVKISFAGDCTLGVFRGMEYAGSYDEYYDKYGQEYTFRNVLPYFAADDITFVNLEGPFTEEDYAELKKRFPVRCRPENVGALQSGSIEAVMVANNHTWDCGEQGFADTVDVLNAAKICIVGDGYSCTRTVNGITVTLLGYRSFEEGDEWLKQLMAEEIAQFKKDGSEVVIVHIHSGVEGHYEPSPWQRELFHFAVDSGADLVVGSHPHVVQEIELYQGKRICYSLGNFAFGANVNPVDKDTFIYQAVFEKDGDRVRLAREYIIPCSVSSNEDYNNYQPTPLTGSERERLYREIIAGAEGPVPVLLK